MQLKITNISDGHHYFDFDVNASELQLSSEYKSPIHLDVDLEKSSDNIIVKCDILYNKDFNCDRCLSNFTRSTETKFTIVYIHNEETVRSEDDNFIIVPKEQDIIDISSIVKDYILLSEPMKILCKTDCKGICPKCGKDLNFDICDCKNDEIDPRWEKLKYIK